MTHVVNEATGEVTFELEDTVFKVKASMSRLADYMGHLNVPGFAMMHMMIAQQDPRAIYHGLRCLCTSGNADKFKDMVLSRHLLVIVPALLAAITVGLPKGDDEETPQGNGEGTKTTVN
jgi:hypothetical protein